MGRPSVREERREQIVRAATAVLQRHGYVATTLERIAEECGMSRGHVHHFIGNRDEVLTEVAERFWAEDELRQRPPASVEEAVDYFFGTEYTEGPEENVLIRALIEAAHELPAIGRIMRAAYEVRCGWVAEALRTEFPAADPARIAEISYGIFGLALGNAVLADLDLESARGAAPRRAAMAMVDQLRTEVAEAADGGRR